MNKHSQGRKINKEEHLELLEKMKQFQQQKNVTYLKNATVEQVLKELKQCDEVVCKLKDNSVLRVRENAVFINGILSESIKPTDKETGATYEQGIRKSNNYTGVQHFKTILEKYLD
jgi:hypothetical protein